MNDFFIKLVTETYRDNTGL